MLIRRYRKFVDKLRTGGNPLFTDLTPPPFPSRWQGRKTAEKLVDLTRLNQGYTISQQYTNTPSNTDPVVYGSSIHKHIHYCIGIYYYFDIDLK